MHDIDFFGDVLLFIFMCIHNNTAFVHYERLAKSMHALYVNTENFLVFFCQRYLKIILHFVCAKKQDLICDLLHAQTQTKMKYICQVLDVC